MPDESPAQLPADATRGWCVIAMSPADEVRIMEAKIAGVVELKRPLGQSGSSISATVTVNYGAMSLPQLKEQCREARLKVGGNR